MPTDEAAPVSLLKDSKCFCTIVLSLSCEKYPLYSGCTACPGTATMMLMIQATRYLYTAPPFFVKRQPFGKITGQRGRRHEKLINGNIGQEPGVVAPDMEPLRVEHIFLDGIHQVIHDQ